MQPASLPLVSCANASWFIRYLGKGLEQGQHWVQFAWCDRDVSLNSGDQKHLFSFFKNIKVVEHNHRVVWVGRGVEEYLVPTPCRGQEHLPLDQVVPGPVQPCLEHL